MTRIHISQGETLGNVEGDVAPSILKSCSLGRWWPRALKAGRCPYVVGGHIFLQLIQPAQNRVFLLLRLLLGICSDPCCLEGWKSLIWLNVISGQSVGVAVLSFGFSSAFRSVVHPQMLVRNGSSALTCSGGSCPFPEMEGWKWVGEDPTCTTAETSSAARTKTRWPGATFEDLAANKPLQPTGSDD